MSRLYLVVILILCPASIARGQSITAVEPPVLGNTLTANVLADLPGAGGNLFTLLDTVIPQVITDRVDTGGLSTGQAARVGAHGSSWTQTRFRVDGVDITDSDGTGTPMVLPGILQWDSVDVSTGRMPMDIDAPGLAVSLTPRRPAASWTRSVDAIGTWPSLVAGKTVRTPPAIARLNSGAYASLLVSGPIVPDRLGIVVAGTVNGSKRYERADPTLLDARHGSFFTHVVFTPNSADELRVIGWADRSTVPLENRIAFGQPAATESTTGAHVQAVLEHRDAKALAWAAFGGFSLRKRTFDVTPAASIVIERTTDGPPASYLYPGPGTDITWSFGTRLKEPPSEGTNLRHGPQLGIELSGSRATMRSAFSGRIGELVGGMPARVWQYSSQPSVSSWNSIAFTAYGADRIQVSRRLTIDAGLRYEGVLAAAGSGGHRFTWNTFLPRAGIRIEILQRGRVAGLVGYGRTAHRLQLTDLVWGDLLAPEGTVSRWNTSGPPHAPAASEIGTLIGPVGPGGGVSRIDGNLRRPYMDELTFGFETRLRQATVFRLIGLGRRERDLMSIINTTVPESAYTVFPLNDPGLFGTGQALPIFNRPVATFGTDRYQLTNPPEHETTFVGAELTGQTELSRLFLLLGLTAGRSEGLSANVGFNAKENDAALVGEVFIDPNARTYAQGRFFTERGYTIKLAAVIRFAWDLKLGMAARYQDGEHFARLIIVPGLNQGPELVRAFRNGRTRFTFTGTWDIRLQKGFVVGGRRFSGLLDVYNLLNTKLEIEEFQLTGPLSRSTTAIQPPRAIHIGLRVPF